MSKISEFFTPDMMMAVGFFIVGHALGWFAGNAQFVWEFWKDKPVILRQVSKWNYTKLEIVRKSIIAKKKIKKDEILTKENLTVKRPGGGISPMKWDTIIGTKASKNYNEDDLI